MPFQSIFGSCFPFSEEQADQNGGQTRNLDEFEARKSHARSRSERSIFNWGRNVEEPEETRSPTPFPLITVEEADSMPRRPHAVRSHSCPSSARDAQRGNSPYGPMLTIHDAGLANELLGSTSSLGNGQYSFLNGEFIPRPTSGLSNHTRRASMPGDLRSCASPSPVHTHVRAAQSMGNLNVNPGDFGPFPMGMGRAYGVSSPSATTFDTRRDSMGTFTDTTSFDQDSMHSDLDVPVPVPTSNEPEAVAISPREVIPAVEEPVETPAVSVPVPTSNELETVVSDIVEEGSTEAPAAQTLTECKEAVVRIKIALEEKASLERRLQELERLISRGNSQRPARFRSATTSGALESVPQPSRTEIVVEATTAAPTTAQRSLESQQDTQVDSNRETSLEDGTPRPRNSLPVSPPTFTQPAPQSQPQPQRQRPVLPQLQTSLPLPTASEERRTPSTAVRLTSAVSRIANWMFGEEERSPYPTTPMPPSTPHTRTQRPQTYQLIQAHHLQLTPTSPQHRRTAHLSAPATTGSPVPVIGYQQRWRPRNVEDVDPVPPYHEQDPNPSPGFVFFPQNSLLTPLATPTSPPGTSIATQMYAQAV
ncbi:hypothetical protein TWF192_011207 [Orbilia oligospora]|uniref:Uncharacterized protein n=1 Tax=Orbilia oligospora TaxID=2813651 RepID=A0A6G1LWK9_ORBOL|nr:hypothetical protein TWF191_001468 [Orbilia oligospora]KAF3237041.1 hypothetical protein TWF192_011207 [Orbilia oligospora]